MINLKKLNWWKSKQERSQEIADRAEAARQIEILREHSDWFNALAPQEQQLYLKVTESLCDDIELWEPLNWGSRLMRSQALSIFVSYKGIHLAGADVPLLGNTTYNWFMTINTAYDCALDVMNQKKDKQRLEKIEMKLKELESR